MPTFLHAQQAVVVAGAKSFQDFAKAQSDAAKAQAASAPKGKKP